MGTDGRFTERPQRLTDLTGIDRRVAAQMRAAGFTDVEHVSAATQFQLQTVDGISSGLAARLLVETETIEPSEHVRTAVGEIAVDPQSEDSPAEADDPIETLTDITGVDRELATRLRDRGFRTVEHVSAANRAQLAAVDGIGGPFAERILAETEDVDVSEQLREEMASEANELSPDRWGPDAYLAYALLAVGIAAGALYTGATTAGIVLIGLVVASGTLYDFLAE